MKKLVTLLLALLLSLSLTVPAMAEVFVNATLSSNTYNDIVTMCGNTTVEKNAVITFNQMADVSGSLTVEAGASLTSDWSMQIAKNGSLMVEAGATVTTNRNMIIDGKVTVGGKLKGEGGLTINGNISLLPGGEVDVMLKLEGQADKLVSKLLENGKEKIDTKTEQFADGYHVTAHGHDFEDGVCTICDYECKHETKTNGVCDTCGLCFHEAWTDGICDNCGYSCSHEAWTEDGVCTVCGVSAPSGFTLSQGNLWIVLSVVVVAVVAVVAVVLGKKKKG